MALEQNQQMRAEPVTLEGTWARLEPLCMEHAEPSCVYACPHDAAHRVEPLTFFGGMLGIEQRTPQKSTTETSK